MVKNNSREQEDKKEDQEHKHSFHKKKLITERIRENPWILSSIVLGIFVLMLIISNAYGFSGKSISEKKASDKLINFLNEQTGGGVKYVSSENVGGLYKITVSYEEQNIPVYITKDGKYYVQMVVPLEEEKKNTENTNSNSNTQQVNVPKSDKPIVELFVMSYCPYGTQAEKGIIPALELLGDKVDFKLRFVYYAMHPTQGEVEENLRQYCIQKEQQAKLIPYLKCFLEEGKSEECLTEAKIDKTKLNTCIKTSDTKFEISKNKNDKSLWLSGYYPLFNVDKELNEKYGIRGSPTLVINGVQVSSARDPSSYLNTICNAFTKVPEECNTKLSTTSYSAGFGYGSSGSASSGAQCG